MTTDTLELDPRSALCKLITPSLLALPLCLAACAIAPGDASSDIVPEATAAKHCAVNLRGDTTCYATFNEAISHATGGRITDADAGDGAALADRVNALGADHIANVADGVTTSFEGTTMIGTVYKSWHFLHDEQTWTFFVPGNVSCDGNRDTSDYSVVNLNTSPFTVSDINDQISSFQAFGSCSMVLWTDWFFGGPATNAGFPVTSMFYVGDAMNDRASSIAWF